MPGRAANVARRRAPEIVVVGCLAALVTWWTWRALHDPSTWDTGLAYHAGQVAWATGHPEHVASWSGTPFLAAIMALLGRVVSVNTVADLVTALSAAMATGAAALVLYRTRALMSRTWWAIGALGLFSFGPLMSTVWSKQFNLISLVLALAGFELVRRRRGGYGGAAIGLSVAFKPMMILLPFVLLAVRGTRRAGAVAVAVVLGLNLAAQSLLAGRAHDLAALDPFMALRNFADKSHPSVFICVPWNLAPGATLCRLVGLQHWTIQRLAVLGAVLLLGLWLIDALRAYRATSWEVFAFVGPLSAMLSPLAWTHYQIMLAPLFFLLLFRFSREGAGLGSWAGLAVAFVLASLVWAPFGSSLSAIHGLVSGTTPVAHEPVFAEGFAQFAQYILVLTGLIFCAARDPAATLQRGGRSRQSLKRADAPP